MVVPPTDLDRLRGELRQRRRQRALAATDNSVGPYPELEALIAAAHCVGLYRPVGGEPDPLPMLGPYRVDTALPWVSGGRPEMIFRRWQSGDTLVKSTWGGRQPTPDTDLVVPDLIFVPLLGFDHNFNRIGQGGGHYDRYLSAHPSACRIGLAWECQRVESITPRPWDIPMDGILTETTFHTKDLTRCQHR